LGARVGDQIEKLLARDVPESGPRVDGRQEFVNVGGGLVVEREARLLGMVAQNIGQESAETLAFGALKRTTRIPRASSAAPVWWPHGTHLPLSQPAWQEIQNID
jgi:hypothetical protein